MTLIGVEGIHTWTPGDGGDSLELNRIISDDGDPVWPRYKIRRIGGLGSLGDSGASSDPRVGALGEIPRKGYRRGKTTTYEGAIRGRTRGELRTAEAALRTAFQDQTAEGRMDVDLHPDHPEAPLNRYFNAKCLTLELGDEPTSPKRVSHGWERPFVLALRWSDPRYYETLTLDGFKQLILDLDPELYWALDADDGLTDLSGNGHNGTAVGSPSVGAGPALTAIPSDSSTDFNGSSQKITSSYNPFTINSTRTMLGFANMDTAVLGGDTLFASSDSDGPGLFIGGDGNDVLFYSDLTGSSADYLDSWPIDTTLFYVCVYDDDAQEVELYLDGDSQGVVAAPQQYSATPGNFQVGAKTGVFPGWFDGPLSHTAIIARALTTAEINGVAVAASTGARAYY